MKYIKKYLPIFIPLILGTIIGLIINTDSYATINKPILSPPSIVFPIVWSILYLIIGYSYYKSSRSNDINKVYYIQLIINLTWSIIFFNMQMYLFAFFWLLLLWAFVLLVGLAFYRIRKIAGAPWILYLVWVTFAGYLNWMVYALN